MKTSTMAVLVRWYDEVSAECTREDCRDIGRYDCSDFASFIPTFVAATLDDAKRLIEHTLVNDEMLPAEFDDLKSDDIKSEDFKWEQVGDAMHDGTYAEYACYFRNEYVAAMNAEMLTVQTAGGPQ